MKKQILLFILMLMPLMASASTKINGIYYNLNSTNKVAEVTTLFGPAIDCEVCPIPSYTGELVIPKTVTYGGVTYSVTSIGYDAFSGCSGLTSVTIPNGVTSIGSSAFYGCSGLTSVTIPNSVTSIGAGAFVYCEGLTSVTIPNSVTSIGSSSFLCCYNLSTIQVEQGNIVYDSRENCNAIIKTENNELITGCKNSIIPNSVTSIGVGAFVYCEGLTSITIPNSVTSIGNEAFSGCSGLTSVTIPSSVTSIGAWAFSGCSGLTSVTIPSSVTSIGAWAFSGCSGLTSVTIPSSVTSIGESAFSGCSGLTSVTIPNSVTSIGKEAFSGCNNLEKVTFHCKEIWGWFSGNTSIKEIVIGDEVTSINYGAFSGCSGLTSVAIPNSVTNIGGNVFSSCSGLTSVTIPNSVTSIGQEAFYGCSGLSSVTIPNSVTSIGSSAFYGCFFSSNSFNNNSTLWSSNYWGATICDRETEDGLLIKDKAVVKCRTWATSATIPNSVTSIGDYAFSGCSCLTSITIPNSVTSIGSSAFSGCKNLSTVKIGNGIETIGSKAFAQCPEIKEVYCYAKEVPTISSDTFKDSYYVKFATLYVPEESVDLYKASAWSQFGNIEPLANGILFADDAVEALCLAKWDTNGDGKFGLDEAAAVTSLGSVFANNTDIISFDELQYFTGLTSIGEQAFYYCSNLTSVVIPESVKTIGNRAFYVCSGLKSLHIPASVTSIEDRAFAYCSGLETIKVDENNQYYDSRNNCNALIQTNTNTLLVGCKNSVIPESVTIIAEGAFRGCTELTSMEIPEGVTTIGASAFRGCTGLTSVTLPSTITSIGNYAFSAFDEVYNLTSVTVGMTNPVAMTSEVFPNRANSILYVPKGSRSAYKAANYWKEFKNIVELENGEPAKCETPTITIIASGKIKVECATEGATCFTNITASNAEPLTDSEINLSTPLTVYTITAYATADGYADSDVATATFRWEKTEGDMNGDGQVNISDVIQLVNIILQQ